MRLLRQADPAASLPPAPPRLRPDELQRSFGPAAAPAASARSSRPRLALVATLMLLVLTAGLLAALRLHRSEQPIAHPAPAPPVVDLRVWIDGTSVRPGGTTTLVEGRAYAIAVEVSSAQDVTVTDFHLLLNGPRSGSVGGRPSGNFVSLAYRARPGDPYRASASWIATAVGGSTTVTLGALYSVAQGGLSASVGPSLQTIIVR